MEVVSVRILTHLAVGFVIHIFTLREGMLQPVLQPFAYLMASSMSENIINILHLWLSGCLILETYTVIILSDVIGLRLQRVLGIDEFGVWFLQSRMALEMFLKACNPSGESHQVPAPIVAQSQQSASSSNVDAAGFKDAVLKIFENIVWPMAMFNMMLAYMYVAAVLANIGQQATPSMLPHQENTLFTYFAVSVGIVGMALYQIISGWCYQPAKELLNVAYTKIKDEHYLIGRKLQNAAAKHSSSQQVSQNYLNA